MPRKTKAAAAVFIASLLFLLPAAAVLSQDYGVNVYVDGSKIEFKEEERPFIDEQNRTIVPVRLISESMGAVVDWDGEKKQVTIRRGETTIRLTIGEQEALVNGEWKEFDTRAVIVNDRTMVPLRFIGVTLGAGIDWDSEEKTAHITSPPLEESKPKVEVPEEYYRTETGYWIPPGETRKMLDIDGPALHIGLEIRFTLLVIRDLEQQHEELRLSLESKFGRSAAIDQAISHVKQKTDPDQELSTTSFNINGHLVRVKESKAGNSGIIVEVYRS